MGNSPSAGMNRALAESNSLRIRRQYDEITWSSFLEMIKELNKKCSRFRNENGKYICFALDKSCTDGVFWKNKARIKCFSVRLF
ncbi:hypothetical protein KIN20_025609 [Parelaphostrongylus tenuis]|uniref:Uncharacterized protein n=1 Tax=Parelaphostrongylus tenuis TaxID=148309 RepID=A0AAD5NDF0_PARTN|nr:hypothetical protein KIN20_025609 [Parelaphostrongylus tenuis]